MTQWLRFYPFPRGPKPRRKLSGNSYAEIQFCFLRAEHLHAGLTTTALAAFAGLQNPSSFFFFFFKLRVNIFFFLILLSWHSLLGAKELLRNQGLVRISIFSVYLLNFTFPDDSRLGRCAKSVSADTPPAVHLLFLLISFPRSILCQTYSSGVGRYLYIYRLQRENKSWTCYTTLKKQPNFQQTLFAV